MRIIFTLSILIASVSFSSAQYTINGSAVRENCRCYTLTNTVTFQQGSVWNNNRINLNQNFDFNFQVFLGCSDGGADGISFVLQPIGTNVISTWNAGGGLGILNVSPSVILELDTYANNDPGNLNFGDPAYDHIGLHLNGDLNHNTANSITPLTPITPNSDNVEDCQTHNLRVQWDANSKTMTVSFDGQVRIVKTYDFVANVFSGNGLVYWGFTGATGGLTNQQRFCTSLVPNFYFPPLQSKCVNQPIQFLDSTVSFAGVIKRYWNFGDGSPVDSVNLNPIHTYTTPGVYNVVLKVVGLDGCDETLTRLLTIGGIPTANFSHVENCVTRTVQFTDISTVNTGAVNSWYWDFDNAGQTSTQQNPSTTYATAGTKNIIYVVKSNIGCVSDTLRRSIVIGSLVNPTFGAINAVCTATPAFTINTGSPASVPGTGIGVYSGPGVNAATGVFDPAAAGVGIHPVTYSYTTSAGCVGTATQNIVVNNPRAASIDAIGVLCENDGPVTLVSNPPGGVFSGTGVSSSGIINPAIIGSGTYSISYSFPSEPCITAANLNVVVNPAPQNVSAGPSFLINQGGGVTLQGSGSGVSYLWTPSAGLSNPSVLNPTANPGSTTTYTLTVENNFGCQSTDSMIVTVFIPCLDPPNIFTPNNDGFYDKWIVFNSNCVTNVEASVYNRYGSLVYHAKSYQNQWDGTYNGKPLPDATYYYTLQVIDTNGNKYTKKGNVTIMR